MNPAPICSRCNKALNDWQGNVMIDNAQYTSGRIVGVQVICKNCTRQLHDYGGSKQFHNIWELAWIKEAPMSYLGSMMSDLLQEHETTSKWDADAVREAGFLISLTLPYDEARKFLRHLNLSEWDDDGEYLTRLKKMHGMDVDD